MDEVWQWLMRNNAQVKKLCKRSAKYYEVSAEDQYACALDFLMQFGKRAVFLHSTSHASHANLTTYLLACLEYYLRRNRKKIHPMQTFPVQILDLRLYIDREKERDQTLEVITDTLSRVTQYERWLILCRHVYGLTFQDIADHLGMPKTTVRYHYCNALTKCQEDSQETRLDKFTVALQQSHTPTKSDAPLSNGTASGV